MRRAVLLDRDGVIIENRVDYVRSWNDVSIYPQALAALAQLRAAGWPVVIITNQSMVGRGLVSLAAAEAINHQLVAAVAAAGGQIDAVYMCPHAPSEGCRCRKPQPGLLLQAAQELGLDLAQSAMVGDALSDVSAAEAAGVGWAAMVRTGRGANQELQLEPRRYSSLRIYNTLQAAVAALLGGGAGA